MNTTKKEKNIPKLSEVKLQFKKKKIRQNSNLKLVKDWIKILLGRTLWERGGLRNDLVKGNVTYGRLYYFAQLKEYNWYVYSVVTKDFSICDEKYCKISIVK